ncbi:hypothetical protein GCM10027217_25770 [Pseudomaricurvus hydrocarbonicus]
MGFKGTVVASELETAVVGFFQNHGIVTAGAQQHKLQRILDGDRLQSGISD